MTTKPTVTKPARRRTAAAPAGKPAPKPAAAREGRLSARDWLAAGQDILREQGITGIKLATLTHRLGVSIGSFYHHFTDFEQYLGALAESYSLDRVMSDLDKAAREGDQSPVARLQSLARQSVAAGTFELDHAMRVWATMDPRAEVTLRRAETKVLAFLTDAFSDLGFDADEARLRATVLLSANVSPLLSQTDGSRGEFFRGSLRLVLQGAPGAGDKAAKAAASKPAAAKKRPANGAAKRASRPATRSRSV